MRVTCVLPCIRHRHVHTHWHLWHGVCAHMCVHESLVHLCACVWHICNSPTPVITQEAQT